MTHKGSEKFLVTYSDYLAAILDPEVLCGEINVELLFHTLNPSHMSDIILKNELKGALFFGNEDDDVVKNFEKIRFKQSDKKHMLKRQWFEKYFAKIKEKLVDEPEYSE